MILREWLIKYKEYAGDFKEQKTIAVFINQSDKLWDLFHLSDYIVSSICGGTMWLVKRNN